MTIGEIFSTLFSYTLVHSTIRCMVPIVYAALACSICRQTNVFNMSVEGIMLCSCFVAAIISYKVHSWVLALVCCIILGMLFSALLAFGYLKLKANIVVMAIAINMFATGGTRFMMPLFFNGWGGSFTDKTMVSIPKLVFPALNNNPVLNSLLNNYGLFEVLCPLFIFAMWFLLYKTVWGLRLRTVGLNDMSASTAGIKPEKFKVQALLIAGGLGGMCGAHMALGYVTMFSENMTNGRGYMGMAAMYFGGANPAIVTIACAIFGFCEAISGQVQQVGIPSQFVLMLPYIITIAALAISMATQYNKEKKRKSAAHYIVEGNK